MQFEIQQAFLIQKFRKKIKKKTLYRRDAIYNIIVTILDKRIPNIRFRLTFHFQKNFHFENLNLEFDPISLHLSFIGPFTLSRRLTFYTGPPIFILKPR